MAYSFYNASLIIAQTPKEEFKQLKQEIINNTIEVASNYEIIQAQTSNGGNTYTNLDVRINSVFDTTTQSKLSEEYRKIIFKDYNYNNLLGQYFKFNNLTWIATNLNTTTNLSHNSIVRKCNNKLKWIDNNSILQSWDCVFEREISNTSPKDNKDTVNQIWSTTKIIVQRNQYTNLLKPNNRFLFDGYAFIVDNINNHISDTYIELYMHETQILENDDIVNNIANGKGYINPNITNGIIISPNNNTILLGATQIYEIYTYTNGVKQNDIFEYHLSGTSQSFYEFTSANNSFTVKNLQESNIPLIIKCTDQTTQNYIEFYITLADNWG